MTILQLQIDASGMRQGAQAAAQALGDVQRAARQTGSAIDNIYGSGSRVFRDRTDESARAVGGLSRATIGAAAGALQVGHNFNLLSQQLRVADGSFQSLHTTGLLVAGGLLDIAHITHRVAEQGGEATTTFGKFLNVLKANPLLAMVVTIGAISTAMSLLSSHTKDAANAQETLNRALLESQKSLSAREFDVRIGRRTESDPKTEIDRLQRLVADLKSSEGDGKFTKAELAQALGITTQEVSRLAEGEGVAGTVEQEPFNFLSFRERQSFTTFDSGEVSQLAQARARELQKTIVPDRKPLDDYIASLRQETDLLGQSEKQREQSVAVIQAENIARQQHIDLTDTERAGIREEIALQQQLIEMRQLGQDVGAAIGQGLFNAVTGANNLRQALAGVLQQLIAIGQSRFVQQFATGTGQLFASTGTQRSQSGLTGAFDSGPQG